MQYTKSTEVNIDEADGPRLQSIFSNIEHTGGTVFNVSRRDVPSCFDKINNKTKKKKQI